jgi:glycosyltransferase involved in cell wall biosynthesis
MRTEYKVIHAPTTVGGNPQGLSKALNRLGVLSQSLTLTQNYFNYSCDYVVFSDKDNLLLKEIKKIFCILWVAIKYDVIHYNFGTTIATPICRHSPSTSKISRVKKILRFIYAGYTEFLQFLELKLYRFSTKKLFITYQGDDARQGDYSLAHFKFNIASQVDDAYYYKESDEFKRKSIQLISRYCHQIYAVNPDLLHVLPKGSKFIPYSHILLDDWKPHYTQLESQYLRIGHAPSHRKVKGTEIILNALNALKSEGYCFDLVLVEGMSNAEARKLYETIDVLVDQLFAGWYGGLAVEAMALGKPVIVYIRDEDLKFIPKEMADDLPFICANPENIQEKLAEVLEMPRQDLFELAKKSRAYVEKWHDPLKIAAEIQKDYESS